MILCQCQFAGDAVGARETVHPDLAVQEGQVSVRVLGEHAPGHLGVPGEGQEDSRPVEDRRQEGRQVLPCHQITVPDMARQALV